MNKVTKEKHYTVTGELCVKFLYKINFIGRRKATKKNKQNNYSLKHGQQNVYGDIFYVLKKNKKQQGKKKHFF